MDTTAIIDTLIYTGPIPALARAFMANGTPLYIVGGPVRDTLLGREVHDLDFTTPARPDEIKALLNQSGADTVFAIGEKFGTISAHFGADSVEITTYRAERYDPQSRKPEVRFGDVLEDDLARRDFTMNAIAVDARTGAVVDPFNGIEDITERIIRAVGHPLDRFKEDPLRVLRAVRLACQLGFVIERETRLDAVNQGEQLQWISKERISQELTKLLMADAPSYGLRLLVQMGLMDFIIPEILEMQGMDQGWVHHKDVYEHTLAVVDRIDPTPSRRWAALLHDIAKPRTRAIDDDGKVTFWQHEIIGERMAHQIMRRLRMDNGFVNHVGLLVKLHMWANAYTDMWTDGATRRFIRQADPHLDDLIALSSADCTTLHPARQAAAQERVEALRARVQEIDASRDIIEMDSPLDGDELMQIYNMGPGVWIRKIKDRLLEAVLDGDIDQDDKEGAREIADAVVAELRAEATV